MLTCSGCGSEALIGLRLLPALRAPAAEPLRRVRLCLRARLRVLSPLRSGARPGRRARRRRGPPPARRRRPDTGPKPDGAEREADRRQVTVLFADLSGFTALAERLDPEEVRAFQNALFETLAQAIARYDGFVEKFVGDAVMAVFGAPVAHEDDPAAGAATPRSTCSSAARRSASEWAARLGQPVTLHIGIHTGPVVAGSLGGAAGGGLRGDGRHREHDRRGSCRRRRPGRSWCPRPPTRSRGTRFAFESGGRGGAARARPSRSSSTACSARSPSRDRRAGWPRSGWRRRWSAATDELEQLHGRVRPDAARAARRW